jgi:hypothetical protein
MKTRTVITIPIPVPDKAFNALCDYMDEVRCKRDIAFVAGDAILAYIANGRARAAEAPGQAPRGFQWKDVFLPDGTRLKTRVRRRTYYAAVQGDRIQCEKTSLRARFVSLRLRLNVAFGLSRFAIEREAPENLSVSIASDVAFYP